MKTRCFGDALDARGMMEVSRGVSSALSTRDARLKTSWLGNKAAVRRV